MRLMQFAAVLLLLTSISFAEPINLTPIVPAVAIIVAIFLAIMLMFANMMASPQLLAWVKSELRELIAGAIIITIIFSLFVTSQGLSQAITGEENYTNASVNIIDNMLSNETSGFDTAYKTIIRATTKIRMGMSYSPYMGVPAWYFYITYSAAPFSGMSIMMAPLGMATQGLTNVIFLYESIRLLIMYFSATVPTILLPLAFSLRLIPFTRRVGNTLIALSLGVILLLPLAVILVGEVNSIIDYPNVTIRNIDRLDAQAWSMEFGAAFCGVKPIRFILTLGEYGFAFLTCGWLLLIIPWGVAAFPGCYELVAEVVYPIIMSVIKIIQTVLLLVWLLWAEISVGATGGFGPTGWPGKVFDILMPFLENVNNVVLVGYIDLVLIAIIVISGTKSISTALGGEWYLAGVERLI